MFCVNKKRDKNPNFIAILFADVRAINKNPYNNIWYDKNKRKKFF